MNTVAQASVFEYSLSLAIPAAFILLIIVICIKMMRSSRKDESPSLLAFLLNHKVYLFLLLGIPLLFWPQLDFCWQLIHNWIGGWTNREIIKGTMADSYSVFSSIVASFSLVVGLFSYWVATKNNQDEDFKRLQMREFDHVFGAFERYCDTLSACVLKEGSDVFVGDQIISHLYEKYRRRELKLLNHICCFGGDANSVELEKSRAELARLDADFMAEFTSAKLHSAAQVLFKELNWVWALERSMRELYEDKSSRATDVGKVRDRLVALLSYELGPAGQFVFGKYRHHSYGIEKLMIAARRQGAKLDRPTSYRGVYYADMLFEYERTLLTYAYSEKEKEDLMNRVCTAIQNRDEAEELIHEVILPRESTGERIYSKEFLKRMCGC